MQNWVIIDESFLNFLRSKEHRIPFSNYRHFLSEIEKNKYIGLLKQELLQINKMGIDKKAQEVYVLKQKFPEHIVSKRCLDFSLLELYANQYTSIPKKHADRRVFT